MLTLASILDESPPGPVRNSQCHDCPFLYAVRGSVITTDYVRQGKFMCHNDSWEQCKGFADSGLTAIEDEPSPLGLRRIKVIHD